MNSLPQRIISAAVALSLILAMNHFYAARGIGWLGLVLCSVGVYEYQRIAFSRFTLRFSLRALFIAICVALLFISTFAVPYLREIWGCMISAYFAATLWLLRERTDNDTLLKLLALSGLGFLYCAMLPSFALGLLTFDSGNWWFVFLLATVFSGDVFAYFGGVLFGKKKLMPSLSPNKTFAGSVAGVIGSTSCAALFKWTGLELVPLPYLMIVAFLAAVLAQNGDLFESLLKRVASVKDSGHFMPGHGGVLDRLDGVYFAAPVVFAASQVLT